MIMRPPYQRDVSTASQRTPSSWDLLERVSATALDEDYANAAAHREDDPRGRRRMPRVLGSLGLVGLGILVTTTALQTRSDESAEAQERTALISRINDREAEISQLADRTDQLESTVEEMQGANEQIGSRGEDLLDTLNKSQLLAGSVPVTGPGVQITVDDQSAGVSSSGGTILDVDLQVLVNGLWQAGAEAIAINGNRLGPLSAIRTAGRAITVNYNSLTRPYVVTAIGDPDTLEASFAETPGGQAWFDLETNYGIHFDMETVDDLSLPSVPKERLDAQYATRQGELP
jgi:uncharacterized protein YlxW (UPF0749 family)